MRVTWGNIADGAIQELKARVDSVSRAASWDGCPTWNALDSTTELELMRRKASWNNLGMTDQEILAEIRAGE